MSGFVMKTSLSAGREPVGGRAEKKLGGKTEGTRRSGRTSSSRGEKAKGAAMIRAKPQRGGWQKPPFPRASMPWPHPIAEGLTAAVPGPSRGHKFFGKEIGQTRVAAVAAADIKRGEGMEKA